MADDTTVSRRVRTKVLTDNQRIVSDIADAMGRLPPELDPEILGVIQRAAAYLGNPSDTSSTNTASIAKRAASPPDSTSPWVSILSPLFGNNEATSEEFRNTVMSARNNVIDVINRVNSFVARAKNSGFAPPSNPFVRIAELNSIRGGGKIDVADEEAGDIIENISIYLRFLKAEQEGSIDISKGFEAAAQLSSVGLSLEGFGGSGDTAADLLRFLPDLDALKQKKAKEAFSILDFKKRIPRVIFTANYSLDNDLKGSLVAWKKMPDASGYVVRRRNLFTGEEFSWVYSNEELQAVTDNLSDYVNSWVLGFYSNIHSSDIFVCLDGTIERHNYYAYTVQAYQLFNSLEGTMFSVDSIPLNISIQQRLDIHDKLAILDPTQGRDSISPWPVIAQSILGNADYDWILAGVNLRASVTRRDGRAETRGYSYLAAQLKYIFDQMDAGKFVIPQDVNQVVKNVQQSINKFGITQAIQEVLQETGILYTFEGKDVQEDTHFRRVGTANTDTSNMLALIAASIDPETATMDLRTLASNLPVLLKSGGSVGLSDTLSPGLNPRTEAISQEIEAPKANSENGFSAEDELQFFQTLGKLDDSHVDLTTFDGISTMVRTIRIISDIGSSRGASVSEKPDTVELTDTGAPVARRRGISVFETPTQQTPEDAVTKGPSSF